MVRRYERTTGSRDLIIEKNKGKYRPDIIDNKNKIIYDFKFGYPNKTIEQLNMTRQMQNYRNHFRMPTRIIRPGMPYSPIFLDGNINEKHSQGLDERISNS